MSKKEQNNRRHIYIYIYIGKAAGNSSRKYLGSAHSDLQTPIHIQKNL